MDVPVPARRLICAAALGFAIFVPDMAIGEARHCLTKEQQRAAIVSGKALRLAMVARAAKGRLGGDVVGARLCEGGRGLVYMLTLLARDGKVTRLTVDAASGVVIGRR